jgi:hypothetical protein
VAIGLLGLLVFEWQSGILEPLCLGAGVEFTNGD